MSKTLILETKRSLWFNNHNHDATNDLYIERLQTAFEDNVNYKLKEILHLPGMLSKKVISSWIDLYNKKADGFDMEYYFDRTSTGILTVCFVSYNYLFFYLLYVFL
jgi:hypothetical protein